MSNDSVSALNNYLQSIGKESSLSWFEERSGPEHNPEWTMTCKIDDKPIATGSGPQKQAAKDAAAKGALDKLQQGG
ncbi:uncharacterized protein PHACADRAFT_190624 [Phanerochaete carnosa HHB-10118-sp]|uniref:DRBM domain-containing protein n=1 Tax=Phanerochaete carnosa (strain HHB-10118-sp) TaxID=650164 RepID=K5WBZ0_PHACS|nr:uncharacterized protein PHACADRAFT_190624 [Phanerochaete carnosa HHB-10118-sp]EKM61458.1 hypothetical protein PHACADRAFT_190624 [Phanerochaete carnosa HHB-10118-sp]